MIWKSSGKVNGMEESKEHEGWLAWIDRIGSHPRLILMGFIVTLLALIVMVVLFFVGQTERDLVYAVNPVQTKIVTQGQARELEVLHKGEKLGDVDVTAVQVAIWNTGDESIRATNVLKEVVIWTHDGVPILEATVVEQSRDVEVTGLGIVEDSEEMRKGRIRVRWDILEKNDGASFQLICVGATDINVGVEGLIEGSGEVRGIVSGVKVKTPIEQVKNVQKLQWFGWFFLLMGSIMLIVVVPAVVRGRLSTGKQKVTELRREAAKMRRTTGYTSIVMGVVSLGMGCWLLISFNVTVSPFGF
ncbi:hypothetical protein ES703_20940 [subsurface metagenome]